ncbi:MAG: thioredoxin [Cyclobacteriaceae bacterium]|nr:thioredoxin [Cyclobacteriaceae bacterium HetDA_MAG_MS6]
MKKPPFNQLINGDTPVLVDFYADWCGPCKTLSPIVSQVSFEMKGKVKVIKINTDRNQTLAGKFNIRSIPTLILFRKGKILWRKSGLMNKRELINHLNNSIN